MTRSTPQTREIWNTVEKIKPLLAGRAPEVQGAILCDLLAIWLAGHHVPGDRAATKAMRAEILKAHLESLPELIEVNAKILGTP